MKAFFCWVPKLGGNRATGRGGMYHAATAGKARYLCYLDVHDIHPHIKIPDIRVVREPAFDELEFRGGVMPAYIPR